MHTETGVNAAENTEQRAPQRGELFIVRTNRVHMDHRAAAEGAFQLVFNVFHGAVEGHEITIGADFRVEGGHETAGAVVMDHDVVNTEDLRVSFGKRADIFQKFLIGLSAQNGVYGGAESPQSGQQHETANSQPAPAIGLDAPEAVEKRAEQHHTRGGTVAEGICGCGQKAFGGDFPSHAAKEEKHEQLYGDGAKQHGQRQRGNGKRSGTEQLLHGAADKFHGHNKDHHSHQQRGDIFHTGVTVGVFGVGTPTPQLKAQQGNDSAAGIGQVVKGVCGDGNGAAEQSGGQFSGKEKYIQGDTRCRAACPQFGTHRMRRIQSNASRKDISDSILETSAVSQVKHPGVDAAPFGGYNQKERKVGDTMRKLELLSPAGDLERTEMALAYGADAVYLSGPGYGMRAVGCMDMEKLAAAVRLCHGQGAKAYVTCNTVPTEEEIFRLPAYLRELDALGADAVIVGDMGVLSLCRKHIPHMPIHVSTQAGVMNSAAATALYELGACRVIPARELTLEGLRALRKNTPPSLEIEVFVHGSMCVSFSGRCLLSNYMTGRDANRGQCAQPCRWSYALMEEKRPGEYFPVEETEQGTFILNSRDMCLIDHLDELYEAGADSIKIEGRNKSAYYAATVTNAYRHAVDAVMTGQPLAERWRQEVEQVSHRPYSTGFYYGYPGQHTAESEYSSGSEFIAVVEACSGDGRAIVHQRNRFMPGDELELMMPRGEIVSFVCGELADEEGLPLTVANRPMQRVCLTLPCAAPKWSILRKRK